MIVLKTSQELKLLREANRIIAVILEEIAPMIRPGVSTLDLDKWAERRIISLNARPGFKGYNGFPATLCTSINEEVVHGIPSRDRILEEGDIIGVDVGSIFEGYYGDGARTYAVGEVSEDARRLMRVCEESLELGVKAAVVGNRVTDISVAIDRHVRKHGYEIVRDLTGHGIGRALHEEPQVLNYDSGRKGPKLKANMTLCIEPMITNGTYRVETREDDWTVVTADHSLSTHYEYAVAITDNGPEILTRV